MSQMTPSYEALLPKAFRSYIETEFYQKVSEQAVLEKVISDKAFLKNPVKHIALYTDHGVVHVRDVASQILHVLDQINGVLVPKRESHDFDFMRGYGAAVAYLHDIGMCDFSAQGRFMHPEFAAQWVFSSEFDELLDLLWRENAGNMAWRLLRLATEGPLEQDPHLVLREMLSLSMCHSKSKAPINLLNQPVELRRHMQHRMITSLPYLALQQKRAKAKKKWQKLDAESPHFTRARKKFEQLDKKVKRYETSRKDGELEHDSPFRLYNDFAAESFWWLEQPEAEIKQLVADVIDTLRALRCADALRQRGTTLRTSAGYEIFVDPRTANAIYALRNHDHSRLLLYEGKKPLNAGEANLASSELDGDCNLRVSFHRGSFHTLKAGRKGAFHLAFAINDIQADVIDSFLLPETVDFLGREAPIRRAEEIEILVEGTEDSPDFAERVCGQLAEMDKGLRGKCRAVASLQQADLLEVQRYLKGAPVEERFETKLARNKLIQNISHGGHLLEADAIAWQEVRVISIRTGETLIRQASPSGFVYIPLAEGLQVFPMGGYASVPAKPWVPIGNTGVIRGAIRNAQVVAEKRVELIMIPRQVYIRHWYRTWSTRELPDAFTTWQEEAAPPVPKNTGVENGSPPPDYIPVLEGES